MWVMGNLLVSQLRLHRHLAGANVMDKHYLAICKPFDIALMVGFENINKSTSFTRPTSIGLSQPSFSCSLLLIWIDIHSKCLPNELLHIVISAIETWFFSSSLVRAIKCASLKMKPNYLLLIIYLHNNILTHFFLLMRETFVCAFMFVQTVDTLKVLFGRHIFPFLSLSFFSQSGLYLTSCHSQTEKQVHADEKY